MGDANRFNAAVLCVLGMVDMLEGWLVHVPMPLMGCTMPKWGMFPEVRARKSSLVVLLVAGECDDNENPLVRLVCKSPSMRLKCSKMSLSPASSLMPGSR
jgi:hypothetical protein